MIRLVAGDVGRALSLRVAWRSSGGGYDRLLLSWEEAAFALVRIIHLRVHTLPLPRAARAFLLSSSALSFDPFKYWTTSSFLVDFAFLYKYLLLLCTRRRPPACLSLDDLTIIYSIHPEDILF